MKSSNTSSISGSGGSSVMNKIGDVNTEILKLNMKLKSIDSFHEKFENSLKEEAQLRQNIEKKTFYMNENFLDKFNNLDKKFEVLSSTVTECVEGMNDQVLKEVKDANEKLLTRFQESVKRIDIAEKNSNEVFTNFTLFKTENNKKIISFEEILQKEVQEIKKELRENNLRLEMLEKKVSDNFAITQKDFSQITKDLNSLKNDMEMVKNFKENTILNFKDISDEFIKNESEFNKLTNKILVQISEFESKVKNYEHTYNLQNDSFMSIKKDLYNQIYDTNLNFNNKFQLMNETVFNKLENFEKLNLTFQNSLIIENDRFSSYIADQMENHHKNVKKLGIGDWGLGIGPNPQSPIPNPQYFENSYSSCLNKIRIKKYK
jgi:hypothetical protein